MKKTTGLAVCALLVVVMISGVAFSAEKDAEMQKEKTIITWTINNANQLMDNYGQLMMWLTPKKARNW